MSLSLRFSEVEALFAGVHLVASDKRIAFQGRLKALLRIGLLPDVMLGRGRAATYSAPDVFILGVALELLQLGLSPERAVRVVLDEGRLPIIYAGRYALRFLQWEHERGTIHARWFLRCDPANLSSALGDDDDEARATFWYCSTRDIMDWFGNDEDRATLDLWPRMSLINVSTLVGRLYSVLHETDESRAVAFEQELQEWFESHPEDRNDDSDPEA